VCEHIIPQILKDFLVETSG